MSVQMGTVDRSYLLHEQLGEGAMGTVFRATQLVNGQAVALKLVPRQFASGDELSEDLEVQYRLALAREFQTLASLHHPNVIRVLNYGFDQTYGPYYIMELLEAPLTPLEASLSQSADGRIGLIAQLLRALSYIHQRGVIHRDIKPSNVLVVGGELKLLDFGISVEKFEKAEFAGTAEYMAPELLRGGQPSFSSDLYAVGLLLHHMLTGNLPSNTPSMGRVLQSLLDDDTGPPADLGDTPTIPSDLDAMNDRLADFLDGDLDGGPEPPPMPLELAPEVPAALHAILTKLLAPQVSDRYTNANEVLRDLSAAVSFDLPVETVATRESFLRATMLVGRDAELATLKQAIENTRLGTGSTFLIGGESGVGKSRLIAELRTLALVYGAWVAEGQSVSEGGYYYQEWLPLLRALCFRVDVNDAEASALKGLLPEIGLLLGRAVPDPPVATPEEVQLRIFTSVGSLLQRLTKPLVLVLEDLHWIRTESLALLKRLIQHTAQIPLLVVGTFRSDESPQLPMSLGEMNLIQLSRLDAAQIAQLSESILGLVGQRPSLVTFLERQTEGNAFFLVEVVRALAENVGELDRIGQGELPETVLTVGIDKIVERRIDHLPAEFQPWLEFAATLGRKLDPPALEQAFPSIPLRSFLIECANAAVLETQGVDWRFAHNRLRETVLRRIAPEHRKRLHQEVGEALEAVHTEDKRNDLSATLAYHFEQAGVLLKALRYYIQAGDVATKLYLYEEVRSHYSAAEKTIHQLPDTIEHRRLHADILLKLINYSLQHARLDLNLQRTDKARELLDSLQSVGSAEAKDRLRRARIDYFNARLLNYSGRPAQAASYFKKVLPVAKEFDEQELVLMSSLFLGVGLILQGQPARGAAMLSPLLLPLKDFFGRDIETMRAYMSTACSLASIGKHQQGTVLVDEAYEWVKAINQTICTGLFFTYEALRNHQAGDWPATIAACRQVLALPPEGIEAFSHYLAYDFSASAHSHLGMHDIAFLHRQQAREKRSMVGGGYLEEWCNACEAEAFLNAGQTNEALDKATKVLGRLPPEEIFSRQVAERVVACALARCGSGADEVSAHFQESLRLSDSAEFATQGLLTELLWGQVCEERGEHQAAATHFNRARQRMSPEMSVYALREALLRMNAGGSL